MHTLPKGLQEVFTGQVGAEHSVALIFMAENI